MAKVLRKILCFRNPWHLIHGYHELIMQWFLEYQATNYGWLSMNGQSQMPETSEIWDILNFLLSAWIFWVSCLDLAKIFIQTKTFSVDFWQDQLDTLNIV